ncbi:unnamed protein product [Victoria cruziana]
MSSDFSCPQQLQSLAAEIAQRCGGLPLALVALGRIFSRKNQSIEVWTDCIAGHNWDLTRGENEISSILALSFDDLPHSLKTCLLYCCAFPSGFEIRVERLLRLWIAEGFVQRQGERRLEAVAMDYLEELVARSLIQPCKRNRFGQIKSCRVHDVLLQTLVAAAKDRNFFQIHSANNDSDISKCRRLAIHHRLEQGTPALPLARSFISFTESEPPIYHELVRKNFKLLKVLDLEGVRSFETLPKEIGDLVLLTYLGLRHTSVETVPRSTKKLHKLQTLDLRTSANVRLSKSTFSFNLKAKHVNRMINLRHLYFGNKSRGNSTFNAMEVTPDFGVGGTLKELQTLSYVKAGSWVEKGLCSMTKLRKLGMQVTERYPSRSVLEAIPRLSHLRSLYLHGSLKHLPENAFKKLTKLTLDSSGLLDDPFSGLQTLKSLKCLKLINNAYSGETMRCSAGGFRFLEVINLENLEHLKVIVIERGAFDQLKYMRIASCGNLDKVPQGMENVRQLQELKLIDMAQPFVESVRSNMSKYGINSTLSTIVTTSVVEREFDVGQLK